MTTITIENTTDTRIEKLKKARSAVVALRADIDRAEINPDAYKFIGIRLELKAIRELLDEAIGELDGQ